MTRTFLGTDLAFMISFVLYRVSWYTLHSKINITKVIYSSEDTLWIVKRNNVWLEIFTVFKLNPF